MATWPHESTPLSEAEKWAYRRLLYRAMLDIRNLCQSRGPASRNPFLVHRQYLASRLAGSLADWLHNLADYSARDFAGFDAEWFWREYDGLRKQFVESGLMVYRERFEQDLHRPH